VAGEALSTPRQTLSETNKSPETAEQSDPTIRTPDGIPNQGFIGHELVTAIGVQEVDTYEAAMIEVKASVAVDGEPPDKVQAGAANTVPTSTPPEQPPKPAVLKKGRAARPYRLFLISLILIGVVIVLVQRKQVDDTPVPVPRGVVDPAPVGVDPTSSTATKPGSGGHIF
jgi:hypothetical protein